MQHIWLIIGIKKAVTVFALMYLGKRRSLANKRRELFQLGEDDR